jgi:hypothetical protein
MKMALNIYLRHMTSKNERQILIIFRLFSILVNLEIFAIRDEILKSR